MHENFVWEIYLETETLKMFRSAFGDGSLSKVVIYQWIQCFQDGREVDKEDPCSERPLALLADETVAEV